VRLVYFTAAGLMVFFAAIIAYGLGWLWGLAMLAGAAMLVFLGLSKEEGRSGGDGHAR